MKIISILFVFSLVSCITPFNSFSSKFNDDSIHVGTFENVILTRYGMPLKSEFYIDSIHHHDTITIKSYCEEVNEDMYLITSFYFKDSQLVKKEQKEVVHDQDTNSAFDIERQRILIRRMIRNK